MPRTIDSIVACHEAATERRKAGRSVWEFTFSFAGILPDGVDAMPEDLTDEQAKDLGLKYAAYIRRHPQVKSRRLLDMAADNDAYDPNLDEIVEMLEDVSPLPGDEDSGQDELNGRLDELYDWGDRNRVWIELRRQAA